VATPDQTRDSAAEPAIASLRSAQVHLAYLADHANIDQAILRDFDRHAHDPRVHRSHYFGGRYENIYLSSEQIPALAGVLEPARRCAAAILGLDGRLPQVGFWLNHMAPGQQTLPHSHDDDDELLSGVYYVEVPAGSGELILDDPPLLTRVTPQAGMFVFFRPTVIHEVSRNDSAAARLSMGMNFGPPPGG
jgi:hypothetical protein